jgi:hypothetical protein
MSDKTFLRSALAFGAAVLSLSSVFAGVAAADGGSGHDAAAALFPAKHPVCNNDPGPDASNDPLCRREHRHFHHWR